MAPIRLAEPDDVRQILEIYTPFVLNTPITFEQTVPGLEEFSVRIFTILEQTPWLVCEMDTRIVGYAYASDHRKRESYRWTKETSVYVHPDYRRKGIAQALYSTLIELLKVQGVKNLLAGITLPNDSSIRLHERMGFRKVGTYHAIGYKLGQWHDVGWWELRLSPNSEKPGPIRSIREIIGTPEWDRAIADGMGRLKL